VFSFTNPHIFHPGATHLVVEQAEQFPVLVALQLDHVGAGAGGQAKGHLVGMQMTQQALST